MPENLNEDFSLYKMHSKARKAGVRSGNTFVAPGRGYIRRYLKEGWVLSNTRGKPTLPKEMTELGISCNTVPYSLNKKGRWNIAAFAKDLIDSGKTDFEDGTRVEVVERHKLLRKRQFCVSVHSNSVSPRCQTASGGHYLHYDAVPIPTFKKVPRPPPAKKVKSEVHLGFTDTVIVMEGRVNWEVEEVTPLQPTEEFIRETIPEVQYDVVTPCPASSCLVRSRKHIYVRNDVHDAVREWIMRRQVLFRNKERRARKIKWKSLLEDCLTEDEWEQDSDNLHTGLDDCNGNLERSRTFQLGEAFDVCRKKQTKRHHSGRKASGRKTEDRVKYVTKSRVEEQDEKVNSTDAEVSSRNHEVQSSDQTHVSAPASPSHKALRLLPVHVVLPCEETTSSALRARLGSCYTEARCRPRKFLVDIGQRVRDLLASSKTLAKYRGQELDTTAFVLFTESGGASGSDDDRKVFQVSLNMALHLESVRIETIGDYEYCSLEDVIDKTLRFISTLPVESFVRKSVKANNVHTSAGLSPKKSQVEALNPYEGLLAEALAQSAKCQSSSEEEEEKDSSISVDSVDTGYCSSFQDDISITTVCLICYEDVECCEGEVAGTSLFCGHWFCDACWREHLLSRIQDGASKLMCPAYDCNVSIDAATALTLVAVERVETHLRHVVDVEVTRDSGRKKWCPNPLCGRVLVEMDATGSAWQRVGDASFQRQDEQSLVSTEVKTASGCLDVSCQCGARICWECLESAHWPSTCAQAAAYRQKLRKTGHEEATNGLDMMNAASTAHIRGKLCPYCNRFMMKNGGCKAIVCLCGRSFCWGCLGPAYHDFNSNPRCSQVDDVAGTVLLGVRHIEVGGANAAGGLYKRAVYHHLKQAEDITLFIGRSNRQLVQQFLPLTSILGKQVLARLGVAGAATREATRAALTSQVQEVADRRHELHRLLEHAYVRLEQCRGRGTRLRLRRICRDLSSVASAMDGLLTSKPDLQAFLLRSHLLWQTSCRGVRLLRVALQKSEEQLAGTHAFQ